MFSTIAASVPADPDLPARARRLDLYARVLDGTLYDVLPFAFHEEREMGGRGDYIPLRNRRPSVRYALPRIVVDDSLSLVFGEGHFPEIEVENDPDAKATIAALNRETGLNRAMAEAALFGSVGSVAILMQIVDGEVFWTPMRSTYLTPHWDRRRPGQLDGVTERYKVPGRELAAQGYDVQPDDTAYWFMRRWDAQAETWFLPWAVADAKAVPQVDAANTVEHRLGFVPIAWVRNLPGGDETDGDCTFRLAIDTAIEIDYQLSQAGRGLKYSSDPLLVIREPAAGESDVVRSSANALITSEKGDAKLLEIGGTAASAVIEYVRTLREFAMESIHGNRASPERLTGAQSGRALEMMNQGLIWLADNLRTSYGKGLLDLIRMLAAATAVVEVRVGGTLIELDSRATYILRWPHWYQPTAQERAQDAQALSLLGQAGMVSRETAVRSLADTYNIDDIPAEVARIDADRQAMLAEVPDAGKQARETLT